MAATWHCDICDKPTYVSPPTEPVFEEKDVTYQVPDVDPKTGQVQIDPVTKMPKTREMTLRQKVQKQTIMKRQNPFTGEIEDIVVGEVKDLQARAYIVQLTIGQELVQKDFCLDCLKKHVLPEAKVLWDKLAAISSQE